MKKKFKKLIALGLVAGITVQSLPYSFKPVEIKAAENYPIPAANANLNLEWLSFNGGNIRPYGATVPYTRYDSTDATLKGGAALATSPNMEKNNIASQASNQSYVRLPGNGAALEWRIKGKATGSGVTMRFTMPDSADGMGNSGSLDVYVNGSFKKRVDLTSYYMWQYFSSGNPSDTNNGGAPCFAFDEVHFLLNTPLKENDVIRIQSTGASGLEYGVDFIEVEEVNAPIEQPANSLSVTDFGATPNDNTDDYQAIYNCMREADSRGMDMYIPEGTFRINQIWRLYGSNMKITGAGMWYTNIQFTNSNSGSGGISGGWQTSGSLDGYCSNIEFCNMYINSNLRSRYNEQAVYKCFMDVYTNGSIIHDVWEEHFECGFWMGDYNGKMDYSDNVKIINCRIRNNLADGVNFCQGTSNAVVYNCNIRNCGDDGLAMWNNNYMNAKDESNNVFCYNTIDLIWRAGAIAIYGGNGHKIYNNYIRDTFMAAGIHLNTTFPGYGFTNNSNGITFDNNILVHTGTSSDSWQEELGAVDLKQNVSNVTFNNTYMFDSVHEGVRVLDNSPSNIVFNNSYILGAGVDGQQANYSSVPHNGAAIRLGSTNSAVFNGVTIGNIAYQGEGSPYFFTGGADASNVKNVTMYDGTYNVYPYPEPNAIIPDPIVCDIKSIHGQPYDVTVTGLSYYNQNGSDELKAGDQVTFLVKMENDSNVNIPETNLDVKVEVDGAMVASRSDYRATLAAGQERKITANGTWTATKGAHTVKVTVDYRDKIHDETNENNNSRSRTFNVYPGGTAPFSRVTGGYDLICTDISWGQDKINAGDNLVFTATIANAGDTDIPAGTVIGYQVQIDSNTSDIRWCDTYSSGLKAGQTVNLTCNSGSGSINYWTAVNGTHDVTVWVDDVNRFPNEVREDNNMKTVSISVPDAGYHEHPDGPDWHEFEYPTETSTETTTSEIPTQYVSDVAMEINGYQISNVAKGFRTVYSVSDKNSEVEKVGMIYAVDSKVNADDMVVSSTSPYVYNYDATVNGKLPESISNMQSSSSYVMTMTFDTVSNDFLSTRLALRAYAKLKNGTYVYSNIQKMSVYSVADYLYQNRNMSTYAGHTYLYTDILSVVNKNYAEVDYTWSNIFVKPGDI